MARTPSASLRRAARNLRGLHSPLPLPFPPSVPRPDVWDFCGARAPVTFCAATRLSKWLAGIFSPEQNHHGAA